MLYSEVKFGVAMLIELILIGIFIGAMSGFFGIGGGMILTPMLLLLDFDIKTAIGISIMQMVFSSVFGSYLNYKKGLLLLGEGIYIGSGGFIGGYIGGYITGYISDAILQGLFFALLFFALFRLFFSQNYDESCQTKSLPKPILFLLGLTIGVFSITLGIGGSIILTPLLVGILCYPIKKAVSVGLFFVVFSSIAGLLSRLSTGMIDFESGLVVALSSLVGVIGGIWLKDIISSKNHKTALIILYLFAILILIKKTWL